MNLKNDLILRTLKGEDTERAPVWLMRQAGRILPEYRAIRERVKDFKELIKNPELAAEITLQPIDRLDVDAAIIFSDILVIPEAMGLDYEMVEKKGPFFPTTLKNEGDLDKLHICNPEEDLAYTLDAIRLAKRELDGRVPLIGFSGAPWTLFAYMVEGTGGKTFSTARKALYVNPEFSHRLMDMISQSVTAYLKAQIAAGANLVQLFDSWAGILSPQQYQQFALPYIERICNEIKEVPVIVFAKGANYALTELSKLPCEALGVDWNVEPADARKAAGPDKILQGNLDPCALYASYDQIRAFTRAMLADFGHTRHIANLGHGVYPDTDPEKVKCFVDAVKESKKN